MYKKRIGNNRQKNIFKIDERDQLKTLRNSSKIDNLKTTTKHNTSRLLKLQVKEYSTRSEKNTQEAF